MYMWFRRAGWKLAALASGTTLFLEGCDPQLRATVEDGIITSSSSLLGAFMRALIEVGQETAEETTARAVIDMAQQFFA